MAFDLPMVWAFIIAFAVLAYVILDGFDLGIGILFPWAKTEQERGTMINAIAPVWDGNETWLILGGGGLFAAFPLAYSILMPALYAPLIAMLLGLIFRGVAFEFRFRDSGHRRYWDFGFVAGSIIATFCQGLALGTFVQGVTVADRAYAGGWYDWLSPFTVLTGIALVIGYGLLGACWLILKTSPPIQDRFFQQARVLGIALLVMIVLVSIWTPFLDSDVQTRWFSWPGIVLYAPVPLLVAAGGYGLYWALVNKKERWPFPLALGLFVLSYIGLGISIFPHVVPHTVTIAEAAAPDSSLKFMLVGVVVLLPLIIAYTAYAYWVFRGKIDPEASYH